MSYSTRGSGGGGGGFGGFPYRSAHQQGSDRNSSSNNNSRRNSNSHKSKYLLRRERGGPISCEIQFKIPSCKRGILIGKGGSTIQKLTRDTKCILDVPKTSSSSAVSSNINHRGNNDSTSDLNSNVPALEEYCNITIKASCISHLLHASWVITNIISSSKHEHSHHEDQYKVIISFYSKPNMKSSSIKGCCCMKAKRWMSIESMESQHEDNTKKNIIVKEEKEEVHHDVVHPNATLSAYVISSKKLDPSQVSILMDNQVFLDASLSEVQYHVMELLSLEEEELKKDHWNLSSSSLIHSKQSNAPGILIFIYGTNVPKVQHIYNLLLQYC